MTIFLQGVGILYLRALVADGIMNEKEQQQQMANVQLEVRNIKNSHKEYESTA